jgi:hypothetical protein
MHHGDKALDLLVIDDDGQVIGLEVKALTELRNRAVHYGDLQAGGSQAMLAFRVAALEALFAQYVLSDDEAELLARQPTELLEPEPPTGGEGGDPSPGTSPPRPAPKGRRAAGRRRAA